MSDFTKISNLLAPVLSILTQLTTDIVASTSLSQAEKRTLLKVIAAKLNTTAAKVAAKEI